MGEAEAFEGMKEIAYQRDQAVATAKEELNAFLTTARGGTSYEADTSAGERFHKRYQQEVRAGNEKAADVALEACSVRVVKIKADEGMVVTGDDLALPTIGGEARSCRCWCRRTLRSQYGSGRPIRSSWPAPCNPCA